MQGQWQKVETALIFATATHHNTPYITLVESYKYLVIWLDSGLSFRIRWGQEKEKQLQNVLMSPKKYLVLSVETSKWSSAIELLAETYNASILFWQLG